MPTYITWPRKGFGEVCIDMLCSQMRHWSFFYWDCKPQTQISDGSAIFVMSCGSGVAQIVAWANGLVIFSQESQN